MPRFRFCLLAFLTFVTGLFALSAPCSALQLPLIQNDASKWQQYSSAGEEFAFLLPEQPVVPSVSRPESYSRRLKPGRMYAAYADGAVYVVLSFDNRSSKDGLNTFIKEFPGYPMFHNNMEFERDVSLLGFSGKQYRLKSVGAEGIAQFYLTKNHAYIFEVVSLDINKPAIKQFLTSVSLHGQEKSKNPVAAAEALEATVASMSSSAYTSGVETASQGVDQTSVLKLSEVTRKYFIVTKPEAGYTEEARRQNVVGSVRIRCLLSSTGEIKNVMPLNTLPYGLTEKAIGAALNMKFIPAIKDGKFVSTYVVIDYGFNLY